MYIVCLTAVAYANLHAQIRGDNYEEIMNEVILKQVTVQFSTHTSRIKRDSIGEILFLTYFQDKKLIIFINPPSAI